MPFRLLPLLVSLFGSIGLQAAVSIPADDPLLRYSGRFDFATPTAPRFGWPGVSIEARFSGTSVGIKLSEQTAYTNYFDARIDGGAPVRITSSSTSIVTHSITGLAAGNHSLHLVRRGESFNGATSGQEYSVFHGLNLDAGASLLALPAPPVRKIEVIGDSLSVGYGDEGPGLSCPGQVPQFTNNYLAYGSLVARTFCAEVRSTAISGHGMISNYGDGTSSTYPLPTLFNRVIPGASAPLNDFNAWQPDAVIIFLGTNDFSTGSVPPNGPSQAGYEAAYNALIADIRSKYASSNPWIFCLHHTIWDGSGSFDFGTYVNNVVNYQTVTLGDPKVRSVDMDPYAGTACDYHPSLSEQQAMANRLRIAMASATGWVAGTCPTVGTPTSTATPSATQTPCGACSATATASSTAVLSATPTHTPSPTSTPAPACSPLLVDTFEDGDALHALGGGWASYGDAPATASAVNTMLAGNPASSYGTLYSAGISGTNVFSVYTRVGSIYASFSPALSLPPLDRLIFWFKGTGGSSTWRVTVIRTAIVDYDHYGANFTAPAGVWTRVEIPLSTMAQGGWGTPVPMAWNDVTGLWWFNTAVGAYDITLDDVEFGCPPPPSPTRTVTATRTITATRTPSATSTPTRTASPSPSASATASASASGTGTPSSSPTWTPSPSATPPATASSTASFSATRTPSGTASASPSVTPTFTDVPPGSSATNTPLASPTLTPTPLYDAWDPTDDSSAGATALTIVSPGTTYYSNGHHEGYGIDTQDWYRMDVFAGRLYNVSAVWTAGGSGMVLEIFDSTFSLITSTSGTFNVGYALTAPTNTTLWYRVSVGQPLSYDLNYTDMGTQTATNTRTASPSWTDTRTVTPTRTLTPTPPPSQTATFTPWWAPSDTLTATPSATPGLPATSSATPSETASAPPSSATYTMTPTPGPAAAAPTSTPVASGPNGIAAHAALPNPDPAWIAVKLKGPADSVELKVYSKALVCVAVVRLPAQNAGWCRLPLPALPASGFYSYRVKAYRGGAASLEPGIGSFLVTR